MSRTAFTFLILFAVWPFSAGADERLPGVEPHRVTVRLLEYRFEPSRITLTADEDAELILTNAGTVMHEFIVEALQTLDVDVEINGVVAETLGLAELEIPPKSTVILRFMPQTRGEFRFACRAKNPKDHFKEGMSGTLVVQ
jgi:uncharacterized cupredoxin-like copper-binding protein